MDIGGNPTVINVALGDRSYPIFIGTDLSRVAAEYISESVKPTSITLLTHPHLAANYSDPIGTELERLGYEVHLVLVPAGERTKNLRTIERIHRQLAKLRVDRKGLIISVGGGVLGDIAGFVAASYMRGIRFLQCPTTLLAQVDASIGGKTGVDLPEGKNLVGAFHQPVAVVIDTNTLKTLPARELRSGISEVIKYGIISDKYLFSWLLSDMNSLLRRDLAALTEIMTSSCKIKAGVVSQDEHEQGLRAILNYGHTIGHAIESVTDYRRYKHGEAISIGMVSAALIGNAIGLTPESVTEDIIKVLQSAKLPTAVPSDIALADILSATASDKKRIGSRINWVLASSIGSVVLRNDIDQAVVRDALYRQTELAEPFPIR